MTPQEKAEEIFIMYVNKGLTQIKPLINRVIRKEMAKQCALIAVDEIIKVLYDANDTDEKYGYWTDVKQELIQL